MKGFIGSKLEKRIASAAILIPVSIFLIFHGGIPFIAFLLAWAGIAFYEWLYLSAKTKQQILLSAVGAIYVLISFWCCYKIRMSHTGGIALLFMSMIWASDVGAYAFGKAIGGPKMASMLSPNKTWAGFAGAILCPMLFCFIYFVFWKNPGPVWELDRIEAFLAAMTGVLIGFVGQAGDLVISALKRQAGVKDSSQMIPGHGGVLDRIDAMMLCAPVFLSVLTEFRHVFG